MARSALGEAVPTTTIESFFQRARAEILEHWKRIARTIPAAANLPPQQLLDHVPELLDQIAANAARIAAGNSDTSLWETARRHASERIGEGFPVSALVSELAMLRVAVLEVWNRDSAGTPVELRAVHLAIDRAIAAAAERYEERFERTAAERERVFAKLESLLAAAPIGIAFLDRELRYVRINETLAQINGKTVSEHLGRCVSEVLPMLAHLEAQLAQILETGETLTLELDRADPARSYIASYFAVRARGGDILGIGAIITDVTDPKRTQEQLRAALRSREELLAIVSHDLRNPLGTIVLSASMLAGDLADPAQRKRVDMIERAASHMETLIADLLDTAHIQTGRLTLTTMRQPAADVAFEAVDHYQSLAEAKDIRLLGAIAVGDAELVCDRARVLQVFGNLIGNAIKFCSPGDVITIGAQLTADHVRFSVSDTGPGIPPEIRARIFEPFFTADSAKRGSGLGLYICKGIVSGHGGELVLDDPLCGTTFSFTLPLAR